MTLEERLAATADRAWEVVIEAAPLYATQLGDHRFDDRLPPVTPQQRAEVLARLKSVAAEAGPLAVVAATPGTDPGTATTAAALDAWLAMEIAFRESEVAVWAIDPLEGPQSALLNIPSYHPVETVQQAEAMVARWSAMGPWIDAVRANVGEALADGLVSPASPVRRVVDQLDDLLGRPDEDWPLLDPVRVDRPAWSAAERQRFTDRLTDAVATGIRPAFVRYREQLVDVVLPRARSNDSPGLGTVPGGQAAYASLVRAHTTTDKTPAEIHDIGLAEIARIDAELTELAGRTIGATDLADAHRRLREDPALHFDTGAQVYDTAVRSLERARAAIPQWFGTLPTAPCEVVEMARHEAEHSTIAYYREPAADGSRPGRYYINTAHPETRPRYEAETLAFHESIPGHHLQIAIGQERTDLPTFRRYGGFTAYIEGWGLYTERLSDEMCLYSGDLDRIGVLSFDGWRAGRLVVDTGMHALGWSRDRAIDFMIEHTAIAPNNVGNEIDRYITWPGQALAYKIGQLELLRLRATASDRLGPVFDIRGFHDAVLTESSLPLSVLAGVVDRWLTIEAGDAIS
jgi:uncharacterized protein (DUF885 family)